MIRVERPLPPDDAPPRMTELFVWVSLDPMTDVEGIIAARTPLGAVPLVSPIRRLAEGPMRLAAESAVAAAAEPRPTATLRRFVLADLPAEPDTAVVPERVEHEFAELSGRELDAHLTEAHGVVTGAPFWTIFDPGHRAGWHRRDHL